MANAKRRRRDARPTLPLTVPQQPPSPECSVLPRGLLHRLCDEVGFFVAFCRAGDALEQQGHISDLDKAEQAINDVMGRTRAAMAEALEGMRRTLLDSPEKVAAAAALNGLLVAWNDLCGGAAAEDAALLLGAVAEASHGLWAATEAVPVNPWEALQPVPAPWRPDSPASVPSRKRPGRPAQNDVLLAFAKDLESSEPELADKDVLARFKDGNPGHPIFKNKDPLDAFRAAKKDARKKGERKS
jgi:hypothetical protein